MRVVIFICLLVAGAMALPPNLAEREVVEAETRNAFLELIILGLLEALRFTIDDPLLEDEVSLDLHEIADINGMLHMTGVEVTGLRVFNVEELTVSGIINPIMNCKLSLSELQAQADEYDLRVAHNGLTVNGNGGAFIQLTEVELWVDAQVSLRLSEITMHDCKLKISIGTWLSKIENIVGGEAESHFIDLVLAHLVPELLEYLEDEISEVLCVPIMDLVNN